MAPTLYRPAPIPPDKLAELREKYGERLVELRPSGLCVLALRPKRKEYKQYRRMAREPQLAPDALEALCRTLIVWPPREELDALFGAWPALDIPVGNTLLEAVGL